MRVHSASKCQRQELGTSWDSLWGFLESVVLVVKNPPTSQYRRYKRLRFSPWGNFLFDSDSKESACSAGDKGSIPGLGRAPGEGSGYPLQHSCLENLVDRGVWWAIVHMVAKSQKKLNYKHTMELTLSPTDSAIPMLFVSQGITRGKLHSQAECWLILSGAQRPPVQWKHHHLTPFFSLLSVSVQGHWHWTSHPPQIRHERGDIVLHLEFWQ